MVDDSRGTYVCRRCKQELFSSKEKIETEGRDLRFNKPLDEGRFEFKKSRVKDEVEVRCRKCHWDLGAAVAGEHPYYRMRPSGLTLVPREDIDVVDLVEKGSDVKEKIEEQKQKDEPAPQGIEGMIPALAGIAAGAVLGVGGGLYYCNAFCAVPQTATTTPVATTTEELPLDEETTTPQTNTRPTPAPTQQAVQSATDSAATSSATTSPTSSDGTVQ